MDTLPFRCLPTPGFGEVDGVLQLSPEALQLQYQLHDAVLGVRRPEVHQRRLEMSQIGGAEYAQSLFGLGARIELVLTDIAPLAQFPRENSAVSLRVPRAKRGVARKLVEELKLYLRDQQYQKLQRDIDYLSKQ